MKKKSAFICLIIMIILCNIFVGCNKEEKENIDTEIVKTNFYERVEYIDSDLITQIYSLLLKRDIDM